MKKFIPITHYITMWKYLQKYLISHTFTGDRIKILFAAQSA